MTLEVIYKGRLAHRYKGMTSQRAHACAARWRKYFGILLGQDLLVRVLSDALAKREDQPP